MVDFLQPILERKRRENLRRRAHARLAGASDTGAARDDRGARAIAQLRRQNPTTPRVIAEIKLRSPSAGEIRARRPGLVQSIARAYAAGGASAVSVLCDRAGFGGTPLDLRRARTAVEVPLLFKEFVLDPRQLELARAVGADMALLLVRAVPRPLLHELVDAALALGIAPVVEAADEAELETALTTRATLIGVNARDLKTFRVDPARARSAIALIPGDRVAIHMSGVGSARDLRQVGESRADAVLVGEALMRADAPAAVLRAWLAEAGE